MMAALVPLAVAALCILALMYELRQCTTEILLLQNRLAMSEHYRRQDKARHAMELDRERALSNAAAESSCLIDMEACEAEMDRLEVEDLFAELDGENFN